MPMLLAPTAHRAEEPSLIGAGEPGSELAVQREHVAYDAFRVRPGRKLPQGHIARRLFPACSGVVPFARLVANIFEIALLLEHTRFVGDGAVARDYRFNIEPNQEVAGSNPVLHRPRPHHGSPFIKYEVSGKYRVVAWYVDDGVRVGMCGSQVDEMDLFVAYLQCHRAVEGD